MRRPSNPDATPVPPYRRSRIPGAALAAAVAAFVLVAWSGGSGQAVGHGGPAPANGPPRPSYPQERVDLRGIGHDGGSPEAPVLVVEFSDFGCPYCAQFARETYAAVHEEFVVTGKVQWKSVPFLLGIFPNGMEAALTAECAARQGAFWAMRDRLFQDQAAWKASSEPAALFRRYAEDLGLDAARIDSCYLEEEVGDRIGANNRAANRLGVRSTPTFFVNGRRVEGAIPLEQFRLILARAASG